MQKSHIEQFISLQYEVPSNLKYITIQQTLQIEYDTSTKNSHNLMT